jgi:hypothetical protein
LIQALVQRCDVEVAGLEHAEVLELGEQRQRDLLANVGHLELAGDKAQVLGSPSAAHPAARDESDRLEPAAP